MNKKKVIAKKKVNTKASKKAVVKTAKPKLVLNRIPKAEKKKFEITLTFSPKEIFNATGDSVIECLDQIKPEYLKAKGVFIVRQGNLKSEKVMYPFQIKRLLSGSVSKTLFEKNMIAVMK